MQEPEPLQEPAQGSSITALSESYPIPLPADIDDTPQDVPLYGNDDVPVRDLVGWYDIVHASRGECIVSRKAHERAIAAKETARLAFEESCADEERARQRVLYSDKRRKVSVDNYYRLVGFVFINDPKAPEETEVQVTQRRHRSKPYSRVKVNLKGKGKQRETVKDVDLFQTGAEDSGMDLDNE